MPRYELGADDYRARQRESDFQRTVQEMAAWYGWLTVHFPAMQMNPSGFPDLIIIKGRRTIYAELKVGSNVLSGKQQEWRDKLLGVGAEWHEWRPMDFPAIEEALRDEVPDDPHH